jgi:hypothetical protein
MSMQHISIFIQVFFGQIHDRVLLASGVRRQWLSQTGKANTRTFTMYTMFANQ